MCDFNNADYCYVYLDFNEKLTPNIFTKKLFLRVANLHKPNPLVQVNDLVFKGTYDECTGTNIFFEEIEDPPLQKNIFEKDTPIHLKPIVSQTKIIRLKQAKLPRTLSRNRTKESVFLNLNHDYNVTLEKLQQGILNLDDLAHKPEQNQSQQHVEEFYEHKEQLYTEPEKEIDSYLGVLNNKNPNTLLEAKYEKLKRLARRPVKRMKENELIEEIDLKYKDAYEYHNLERQVCQSSDYFRTTGGAIIDKSFVGGVDFDRCVLHGLLRSTDVELAEDEKRKVFSVNNLENLSIPARYLVLKECVSHIEHSIENTPKEQVEETDKDGRTIMDICNVFRRLVGALERTMGSDPQNLRLKTNIGPSTRPEEDYIKYKHNPKSDILCESYETMFNPADWIEHHKTTTEQKSTSEPDESEDSDSNQ